MGATPCGSSLSSRICRRPGSPGTSDFKRQKLKKKITRKSENKIQRSTTDVAIQRYEVEHVKPTDHPTASPWRRGAPFDEHVEHVSGLRSGRPGGEVVETAPAGQLEQTGRRRRLEQRRHQVAVSRRRQHPGRVPVARHHASLWSGEWRNVTATRRGNRGRTVRDVRTRWTKLRVTARLHLSPTVEASYV